MSAGEKVVVVVVAVLLLVFVFEVLVLEVLVLVVLVLLVVVVVVVVVVVAAFTGQALLSAPVTTITSLSEQLALEQVNVYVPAQSSLYRLTSGLPTAVEVISVVFPSLSNSILNLPEVRSLVPFLAKQLMSTESPTLKLDVEPDFQPA